MSMIPGTLGGSRVGSLTGLALQAGDRARNWSLNLNSSTL
jgi:hypothetical protein